MTKIYQQIENHTYTADKCFLCGCVLTTDNRTDEHVIPRWLQHEFNLWSQRLTLLNGTLIQYRNLTIPCCFECNNLHLNPFEKKVLNAYQKGFDEFSKLDKETLFFWLGKIYYGLMYKQLFISGDRKDPSLGTITNPHYLKQFFLHFLFLQGIRGKLTFKDYFPASIYSFRTQQTSDKQMQWDLIDSHNKLFIAIRMGEIGVIALLQDCETTLGLSEHLDQHRQFPLHPLQFRELATKILYKGILMNRVTNFINVEQNGHIESVLLPFSSLNNRPIFDEWNDGDYSLLLSYITEFPLEDVQPIKGKSHTWLLNDEGKPRFMDINS